MHHREHIGRPWRDVGRNTASFHLQDMSPSFTEPTTSRVSPQVDMTVPAKPQANGAHRRRVRTCRRGASPVLPVRQRRLDAWRSAVILSGHDPGCLCDTQSKLGPAGSKLRGSHREPPRVWSGWLRCVWHTAMAASTLCCLLKCDVFMQPGPSAWEWPWHLCTPWARRLGHKQMFSNSQLLRTHACGQGTDPWGL